MKSSREAPAKNFGENQRIRVDRTRYCYPDKSIACHPLIYDPPDREVVLTNPRVVFEVLSESTEDDDKTEKLYRDIGIESLQEYVLIAQDKPRVETFYRQPDGVWAIGGMTDDLNGTVRLRSMGIDLEMKDIYARVVFPVGKKPVEP